MFLAAAAGAGFLVARLMKSVDTHAVVETVKESVQPEGDTQSGSPTPAIGGPGASAAALPSAGVYPADPAPTTARGPVV